ncbi:hypothetical protein JHW43_009643 [Diplocarpon mali]|nr:hypothetical protein JHW43_009643 [Diplocarpon mali]
MVVSQPRLPSGTSSGRGRPPARGPAERFPGQGGWGGLAGAEQEIAAPPRRTKPRRAAARLSALDLGIWLLAFGCWHLAAGIWLLAFGPWQWTLAFGLWHLDLGIRPLAFGPWAFGSRP